LTDFGRLLKTRPFSLAPITEVIFKKVPKIVAI